MGRTATRPISRACSPEPRDGRPRGAGGPARGKGSVQQQQNKNEKDFLAPTYPGIDRRKTAVRPTWRLGRIAARAISRSAARAEGEGESLYVRSDEIDPRTPEGRSAVASGWLAGLRICGQESALRRRRNLLRGVVRLRARLGPTAEWGVTRASSESDTSSSNTQKG